MIEREDPDDAWLKALAQAPRPLRKTELLGRRPTRADQARLAGLLSSGEIVNLGSGRAMALATRADAQGRFATRQTARQAVLEHLGLSLKPLPLTNAALAKVRVVPHARAALRQAVADLVGQGRLLPLRMGAGSVVIGTDGIRHHLAQRGVTPDPVPAGRPEPHPAPETPAAVAPDALRQAYAAVRAPGASMVEIGALQRRLGCGLEALHACLLHMLDRAEIFLIGGEPAVLSPQDRAAGLPLDGKTYHCIELRQQD